MNEHTYTGEYSFQGTYIFMEIVFMGTVDDEPTGVDV